MPTRFEEDGSADTVSVVTFPLTCACLRRNKCAQSTGTALWSASQRCVGDPGSDDQLLL